MKPRAIRARQGRVALLRGVLVAGAAFGLPGGAVAGVLPVLAAGSGESATPAATSSPAGAVLFGLFLALATLVLFLGLWRVTSAADPVEARLRQYGGAADAPLPLSGDRQVMTRPNHKSGSLGLRLAEALRGADLSWTATEYALIIVGAAVAGFLLGVWRLGILGGLLLGGLGGYLPIWNLRRLNTRRIKLFTQQLPDILTLMVGALRAGYGLAQSLQILVEQLPQPAAGEFARVVRAMGLGVPVQDALQAMADRIGTNDVELVVTTIIVQHQVGGNLAETLATIADTINDRLRIQREIGVMTSQQRLSGYVLVAMPIFIALIIALISPGYFKPFFEPGWARALPFVAVGMQLLGFVLMRKTIDIEV
jgi:tight adherence protein B